MKVIHEVQEGKGKISRLSSYSGGLPAPEFKDNNNPLHHKFSWSPKTCLENLLNGAKFLQNKIVSIKISTYR
jgi:saccharopine dehydrogenase-like NADP-dependent oxidoreductase